MRILDRHAGGERLLDLRTAPVVLGLVNMLLLWWWMGWYLDPAPVIQDEAAYLLQAELFARGTWTGTARPLPEFFAQMHVLTEPVLASKYPPGMSLMLTPFVVLHLTVFAPLFFAAVSGALLFTLARRVANAPVALLTWLLWSSGSMLLRYQGSFLSQTVTLPLWLGTFYWLLEYRANQRPWMLVAIAMCIATMAITRPVTAIALAIPVGIAVMHNVRQAGAWRPLAQATVVGSMIIGVFPLQNHKTTGSWRQSPLVAYSERYAPFDLPGFGYTDTHALGALPPDLHATREYLTEARRRHTLAALPITLSARVRHALHDVFLGWRAPFAILAIIGALAMPLEGLFALGASAGLVAAYAFHAHWPHWTVYYLEGQPAVVFSSAVGLWAVATAVVQRRFWQRLRSGAITDPRLRSTVFGICALLIIPASIALPRYRADWQHNITYQRRLLTALQIIEGVSARSIVFIDYGREHEPDLSLVWNVPDLARARTWLAYDRGRDNMRLMRLAPDRRAFVFRADEGHITPLPPVTAMSEGR